MLESIQYCKADSFALIVSVVLFAALFKDLVNVFHLLIESRLDKPFGEAFRLLDPLLSFLHADLFTIFENIPLDKMPILQLLPLDILLLAPLFDFLALHFMLLLFVAQ